MSGDDFIRAGEAPRHEVKQPVWLMSFADFAGCLLASFVLLYSLAQTDRAKMQAAFGITPTEQVESSDGSADKSMAEKKTDEGRDTDYLATLLQTKIDSAPALKGVTVLAQESSVLLDLPLARLEAKDAERDDDLVFSLAGLISVLPNETSLGADMPLGGPENWNKGMTIANAMKARLQDAGAPEGLIARVGLSADSAPHVRLVIRRQAGE
ncbi:flagellar motor protein MotB [Dongia sp.]|uniref:flagellar motor protein MotB n=1 Tax=Dongia sp. TaxID=1977262 RepID=UPI0035B2E733